MLQGAHVVNPPIHQTTPLHPAAPPDRIRQIRHSKPHPHSKPQITHPLHYVFSKRTHFPPLSSSKPRSIYKRTQSPPNKTHLHPCLPLIASANIIRFAYSIFDPAAPPRHLVMLTPENRTAPRLDVQRVPSPSTLDWSHNQLTDLAASAAASARRSSSPRVDIISRPDRPQQHMINTLVKPRPSSASRSLGCSTIQIQPLIAAGVAANSSRVNSRSGLYSRAMRPRLTSRIASARAKPLPAFLEPDETRSAPPSACRSPEAARTGSMRF